MYTCRVTSNKIEIGQILIELFFGQIEASFYGDYCMELD